MNRYLIKFHSFSDIITNSSSELFIIKNDNNEDVIKLLNNVIIQLQVLSNQKSKLLGDCNYGYEYDNISLLSDFVSNHPLHVEEITKAMGSDNFEGWYTIGINYGDEDMRTFIENNFRYKKIDW